MRKKVSVTIDQKICDKGKELGLNLSKISENAIKACIDAIESINQPKQPFSIDAFQEKRVMAGPMGFEPTTFSLEG